MILRDDSPAQSTTPTPWGVRCRQQDERAYCCNRGELIFLTKACYSAQMSQPDYGWSCPNCGGSATWDDDNYEEYQK